MAKFEAPIIQKWDFMTVWIFLKKKKICMEKVVGEQGLSCNIFYTNPLNFPKVQTAV